MSRISTESAFPAHAGMNRQIVDPRRAARAFPAHAGMNRDDAVLISRHDGVPRACGDEPYPVLPGSAKRRAFPAHAGMNRQGGDAELCPAFPAHAGMNRPS